MTFERRPGRKPKDPFRKRNPEYDRNRNWWKSYRIRPETYAIMLKAQGGVCAICGDEPLNGRYLVVDHDHKTKANRGLLCDHCNLALGHFRENTTTLYAAVRYLESYGPKGPLGPTVTPS